MITNTARISHFFPMEIGRLCAEVTASNVAQLSEILDPAIFSFCSPGGVIVSGDRKKVSNYLRDNIAEYEYDPSLLYEVAQFIEDRQVIGRAADSAATILQHSDVYAGVIDEYANQVEADFNYNMFDLFPEVLIDKSELKMLDNSIQDSYTLIERIRKDPRRGTTIFTATGDLDGWRYMQDEEKVREASVGAQIDYYVRYFFNEYNESRVISDASEKSIANMRVTPGMIWQKLRGLLDTSVHMAVFE